MKTGDHSCLKVVTTPFAKKLVTTAFCKLVTTALRRCLADKNNPLLSLKWWACTAQKLLDLDDALYVSERHVTLNICC